MIEIIPAIDLIGGKCVRLSQGDYGRKSEYAVSPVEMVERYVDAGMTRVHVVDLDGARGEGPVNMPLLEKMASVKGASIEWGGGLKSDTAVRDCFEAGASYAVIGSLAVSRPDLFAGWLEEYGGERMVLGADERDGKVAVKGWLEESELTVDALVEKFLGVGLSQCIVTDIAQDGMLRGPSFALYERLQRTYPGVDFTVSGGVGSIDDIREADRLGLRRIIVGKAIYEGRIQLKDLRAL